MAVAATVLVPLAIDVRGSDAFRLPKEVVFDAASIALLTIIAIAAIFGRIRRADAPPFALFYGVLGAWIAITVATAAQRSLAMHAALSIFGGMALMAIVSSEGQRKELRSVFVLAIPAFPNAALYLLQELRIWNPFISQQQFIAMMASSGRDWRPEIHSASTGLLGNPTDVAGFLLPVVVALAALAASERKKRGIFLLSALVLGAVVISTLILTAVIAMIAALLVLAFVTTRRAAIAAVLIAAVGTISLSLYPPLHKKVQDTVTDLALHRYERIMAGRMPAFMAGWDMAMDHKLLGVGPGCFRYEYFDHKLHIESEHPWMLDSEARPINFDSAHNDHLQVAAETGLPGYALFLMALLLLGRGSFRKPAERSAETDVSDAWRRQEFSRVCSLPLATCFAFLALAQFPLELPAVITGFLYLAGLTVAWRGANENA